MALKTFNIDEKIYNEFSKHCKKNGISMSKKVEKFISEEIEKINSLVEEKPKNQEMHAPKEVHEVHPGAHPLRKYC